MQWPLAHWNVPFLHWKPSQCSSSVLSPQSSSWSQRHRLLMHLPLPHRNSDSLHSRYWPRHRASDSSVPSPQSSEKSHVHCLE